MQSFLLETCLLTNINISLLTQEEWKWALGQPTGREREGERGREREGGGEKSSPETDGASQKVRAG